VAKRSVKKARQRQLHEPPPTAAASPSRRPFWLGVVVAAAVLVPLAVVGVVIASGGDTPADPAAEQQAALKKSIETEAATLRKQTQVRDKEQVKELTDRMRSTVDALAPTLDGLGRTLPPAHDKKVGRLAGAAAVASWRKAVRAENAYFAETVSGETGTNVARGSFAASLDALNESLETYALAVADAGHRSALLERARRQRDLAVRTWSVAATQLDAINISTGYGHQHVFLGGAAQVGGMSPDPAPEGSGATGGG
jgi:hypothetical protein